MRKYDWIIQGGRVLDPAQDRDQVCDIAVKDGRISSIAPRMDPSEADASFDAAGQIVTPGLVDLHVHGYHLATPLGVPVDRYCLGRGVTTAVDAGSAGFSTYPGLRGYAIDHFRTRLLAFLNISCTGLSFSTLGGHPSIPGELESLKLVDTQGCVDCIEADRDVIVGVKVRLSSNLADEGRNEAEAFRRASEAARAVGMPLMVHHTSSSVPLEDCPGKMLTGDVYTHCYHGYPSSVIDPTTRRVHPAVKSARENGVLFDLGHGVGAFSWTVGELCAKEGFWPDIISTDMHSLTCEGPAYDMATVMTRLLHLGLSLPEVIRASTTTPARAIGWEDRIGTLEVGREADIAVFSLQPVDLDLEDCQSQMRRIRRRLEARAVWKAGQQVDLTHPLQWPNPDTIRSQRATWSRLEIHDLAPPAAAEPEPV